MMGRASKGITLQQVQAKERRRVAAILERDRADRSADRLRQAAHIEMAEGRFVNLADSVEEPTPEQIVEAARDGAGFTTFTPRGEDGTVRTVTAYRRRDVPQAYKMLVARVIDIEGLMACKWYRNLYESTGLSGSVRGADYGREVFSAPHQRHLFNDRQLDAQDEYRRIRPMIRSRHLRLLDQMVLEDVPLKRATRAARAFHRDAKKGFAEAVDQLISARDVMKST